MLKSLGVVKQFQEMDADFLGPGLEGEMVEVKN